MSGDPIDSESGPGLESPIPREKVFLDREKLGVDSLVSLADEIVVAEDPDELGLRGGEFEVNGPTIFLCLVIEKRGFIDGDESVVGLRLEPDLPPVITVEELVVDEFFTDNLEVSSTTDLCRVILEMVCQESGGETIIDVETSSISTHFIPIFVIFIFNNKNQIINK